LKLEDRGPVKILEYKSKCPYCGLDSLTVSEYIYNTPFMGSVLITTSICLECGFKHRDVSSLDADNPSKIKVRVLGERELRYMVVKSSSASVKILETGLEYIPGPYSQGYITTIEGLLYEFQEATTIACRDAEDRDKCTSIIEWINKAIDGLVEFTLILCDPSGKSKIYGDNVIEELFDQECMF